MRIRGAWTVALACLALAGCASPFSNGSDIAQQWVGYTVDAWQQKWKGIDPQVFNTETPGEKGYYLWFGSNAHYETANWDSPIGQMPNGTMVMQNNSQTYFVPERHDCDLYFYANAQGVIMRYTLEGRQCGRYLNNWGGPRAYGIFKG